MAELVVVGQHRRRVASATTRPRLSTTPWSATDSALRAFCSTSSTRQALVVARACAAGRRSGRRSAARGPSEGSSSSSIVGRAISARPMTSICRSPPERVCAGAGPPVGEPREEVVDAVEVARPHPAAAAEAAEPEVLLDGELGDHAASLGHVRHAEAGHRPRPARRVMSVPSRSTRAAVGADAGPETVRSSVVLPAPFAPRTAVISPCAAR